MISPQKIRGKDLLNKILQSKHCFTCRICCKFGPDDRIDAPMFTEEIKKRIIRKFPSKNLKFDSIGILYKIILNPLSGKKEHYICPLYDRHTSKCLIYEYRPFDCLTWPFYIMKKVKKIIITLSPDCPFVNKKPLSFLTEFAKAKIAPYMIKEVRRYPDLITEYHGNAKILLDITDIYKRTRIPFDS